MAISVPRSLNSVSRKECGLTASASAGSWFDGLTMSARRKPAIARPELVEGRDPCPNVGSQRATRVVDGLTVSARRKLAIARPELVEGRDPCPNVGSQRGTREA